MSVRVVARAGRGRGCPPGSSVGPAGRHALGSPWLWVCRAVCMRSVGRAQLLQYGMTTFDDVHTFTHMHLNVAAQAWPYGCTDRPTDERNPEKERGDRRIGVC
eukprot:357023-Chlamydomonas_euryale.AAC.8